MPTFEYIQYEVEDPVAVIRLDRPEKLNALTYPMLAEIRAAFEAATHDPAVVGIVVTGNGRGFCAGLDSQTLMETTARGSGSRGTPPEGQLPGIFSYLLHVPKPVIAAVNGVAAGGGLVLAAMSDVRILSREASMVTIFLKRGLIAEHGMTWILPRLVGPGRALDLLWTSERIDAARALEVGLAEQVCEPEELLPVATNYVRRIAASAPPAAIADTKRLVYRHMGMGYAEALDEADAATWAAVDRSDAREGAEALLERREPRFARLQG
jgi:enoyl-CoA hydratase/carnithine racemase